MFGRWILDALIRAQHGVCSTAQARDHGITEDGLRWRVASKRWRRLGRGIYQAQTGDLSWLGRAHAAVLRGQPGARWACVRPSTSTVSCRSPRR